MMTVYAANGAAGAAGGSYSMIIMLVLILVVFYFVLIRPQKKKEKALQEMISNLKVGDEVASIGGDYRKERHSPCYQGRLVKTRGKRGRKTRGKIRGIQIVGADIIRPSASPLGDDIHNTVGADIIRPRNIYVNPRI